MLNETSCHVVILPAGPGFAEAQRPRKVRRANRERMIQKLRAYIISPLITPQSWGIVRRDCRFSFA